MNIPASDFTLIILHVYINYYLNCWIFEILLLFIFEFLKSIKFDILMKSISY